MTLLAKLKRWLGRGRSGPEAGGTDVLVEREPAAESERSVKASPPPSAPTAGPEANEAEPATESERAAAEPSPPSAPRHEPEADEAEPAVEPAAAGAGGAGSAEPVDALDGIGPAYAERLGEAGVDTVADLAAADAADLAERTGLGDGRVAGWIERARSS